jgi:hypothetical protein
MLTGTSEKNEILVMVIRVALHPVNWQITGSGIATKVSGLTSCGQKIYYFVFFAKHALQCSLGTYS